MEKLIEMANAGVGLHIFSPTFLGSYQKDWHITAKREDDGIKLEITSSGPGLGVVIDDIYEKWVKATKGMPHLGLRQIEHQPFDRMPSPDALDAEIPF